MVETVYALLMLISRRSEVMPIVAAELQTRHQEYALCPLYLHIQSVCHPTAALAAKDNAVAKVCHTVTRDARVPPNLQNLAAQLQSDRS